MTVEDCVKCIDNPKNLTFGDAVKDMFNLLFMVRDDPATAYRSILLACSCREWDIEFGDEGWKDLLIPAYMRKKSGSDVNYPMIQEVPAWVELNV